MQSVDHLNIDGPPCPVKCVRKFGSALGGEITYKGVHTCTFFTSVDDFVDARGIQCWILVSNGLPHSHIENQVIAILIAAKKKKFFELIAP